VTKLYLRLQPTDKDDPRGWLRPPELNKEGRFTIKPVPSGAYRLLAGWYDAPYYLKSVFLDRADVTEGGIPVEAGRETEDVLVILSDDVATLRGRVIGEKGPQPGTSVALISVESLMTQEPGMAYSKAGMTDQRGRFEIKGIRPGRYFVLGGRSNWKGPGTFTEFLRSHQDKFQVVELKPKETKEVDVKPVVVNQP
jgi:hypothetical protein